MADVLQLAFYLLFLEKQPLYYDHNFFEIYF